MTVLTQASSSVTAEVEFRGGPIHGERRRYPIPLTTSIAIYDGDGRLWIYRVRCQDGGDAIAWIMQRPR